MLVEEWAVCSLFFDLLLDDCGVGDVFRSLVRYCFGLHGVQMAVRLVLGFAFGSAFA
jgi:hypothetical protein